jgi:hypothetical protein
MRQLYFKFTAAVILLILTFGTISGQQEPGGMYVSGKMTTEQGNVNGAIIRMTRNGQTMKDYQVLPDGKFNLRFEFNNNYVLTFTRSDNFSQKIVVNTVVPGDILRRDRKFPPFPVDIHLYTEIKGIDRTFSENTVIKIFYSASVDNFISETYYNSAQIKKLIDQAIWQSQNVSKESDMLKKLTAAELAELKKEYGEFIKKAGAEFDKGEYIAALGNYKSAGRIFPNEQFPKDRIAEINDLIAVLGLQAELDKQQSEKYNQFIRIADQSFKSGSFPAAKDNYNQALFIKPGDSYSNSQLAEIDRLLSEQQLIGKYKEMIAVADKAYDEKLWAQAKSGYQEAGKLRPGESYPPEQIAKIDEILKNIAERAKADQAYKQVIAGADKLFTEKKYPQAGIEYQKALNILPGDLYSQSMLSKIKAMEEESARIIAENEAAEKARIQSEQEQKNGLYKSLIDEGDRLANQNDLVAAVGKFRAALEVKPRETYPLQRIEEIRGIIVRQQEIKKAYDEAVAKGDKAFTARQYGVARTGYQQAQQAKSDEKYPGEMLAKIDAIEGEQAKLAAEKKAADEAALLATDLKYDAAILKADKALSDKLLDNAENGYREAIRIKPQESYPTAQIVKINALRASLLKEKFDSYIALGDQALAAERFEEAEKNFKEAQLFIPADKNVQEKLVETARRKQAKLAANQEAENNNRDYTRFIQSGDKAFDSKQYVQASGSYRNAATVKPEESYPRIQLQKIDSIIKVMETEEAYRTILVDADAAYRTNDWENAKMKYSKASDLKPSEEYPKKQIQKIDEIIQRLAQQRASKNEPSVKSIDPAPKTDGKPPESQTVKNLSGEDDGLYSSIITTADQSFTNKEYNVSRAWYYKALEVRPQESHPQDRIHEINQLLGNMQLSQTDREFQQYIDKGDEAFRSEQMAVSRSWYNKALAIKPNDKYPKSQLVEIQMKIDEKLQGNTEKTFNNYMELGNKSFDQKQYNVARIWFQRALQIKPNNQLPREKLAAATKALAGE